MRPLQKELIMWKIWSKIAKKNLDHYNDHPSEHMAFAVGWILVSGAVVNHFGKRYLENH
jgi:hypothetical protein